MCQASYATYLPACICLSNILPSIYLYVYPGVYISFSVWFSREHLEIWFGVHTAHGVTH